MSAQVQPLNDSRSQMPLSTVRPGPTADLDAEATENDAKSKEQPVETIVEPSVVLDGPPLLEPEPYRQYSPEEFDAMLK